MVETTNQTNYNYTFFINNYDGLFSFFLTNLAFSLKELNDRYKEIKVYENTIKDEYFIKVLKNSVVYTLYLVRMKKTVSKTNEKELENMEKELKNIIENELKDVSTVIEFDKALDIWLKIIEIVSKISYLPTVVIPSERKEETEAEELPPERFIPLE